LAWLLLAASQFLLAWVLLEVLDHYHGVAAPKLELGLNAALAERLFGATLILLLVLAPLLSARSLYRETLHGTDQLLGSSPVSLASVLLGKLAAVFGPLALIALMPVLLSALLLGVSPVDMGLLLAAALGIALSALLFAAVGFFSASLIRQPALSTAIAYAVLVLLSLIHDADQLAATRLSLLDWLSWTQHLVWLFNGVVRVSDLGYFVLMTALFLALAHRQLANRRLN
jgi:ABC-2 type transport system permease protein